MKHNIHVNNDDNYATPPELYNENKITPETDGLLKDWGKSNFVNPPYSRVLKEAFILKALEESKKGKRSVFLIPVSTSTKLFHDHIQPNAKEIRFIKGRVKFGKINNEGEFILSTDKKTGKPAHGTKDSMIVVI